MIITPKTIDKACSDLAFWLKRWSRYPLGYAIECCGIVPTYQQAEILNAIPKYRFVAVRSGHGIGKSKLIGILVNWYMDTQKRPGHSCRIPITGAAYDQLKDIVLPEISNVNEGKWKILSQNYELTSDAFYHRGERENWFASLRTARADNPTALQGFHNCLYIMEEAFGIPEPIFEVARGAMGDPESFGLMVGNPTSNAGYVYNAFHSPTSVWHCLHFSSADSLSDTEYSYPYIDPLGNIVTITHRGRQTRQWVEDMKAEFGEESNTYRIRVLGEFASGANDTVIESQWLRNVRSNPDPADLKERKIVMGVDVARSGDDDTAICIRQGRKILHIESWHIPDTTVSRQRIEARYREFSCDSAWIDIIGVGAGIYDEMRHAGRYRVYPVTVSNTAPEDSDAKCKLLRDFLWWKGRKFFKKGNAVFSGDGKAEEWSGLETELTTPTYSYKGGKVVVESKEDLKKRGFRSPNRADAFLMTLLHDFDLSGAITLPSSRNGRSARKRREESFAVM